MSKFFIVSMIVISFVLLSVGALFAADNQQYTFEVKLLLNSKKVLASNNVLVKDLQCSGPQYGTIRSPR